MAKAGPVDDLSDFFDVRKPFPKVYLKGPTTQGRVKVGEMDLPPPDTTDDLELANTMQWTKYKEVERQKLLDQAAGSVRETSEWSVARSGMSGVEADTFLGSLPSQHVKEDDKDLTSVFNFKKSGDGWKLPITNYREKIMDLISCHQVVVLSGHTGCGKTTQVPQYILDKYAREKRMVNIIVTQPRKIAAKSVASRVCQERGWELGGLVGYQVGLDKANKSPDTRLLYVTTGVLKRKLIAKKQLNEWTHIVLDEVHEREENMDLVMLMIKKMIFTNSRDTKLILMSATMNEQNFIDYFSSHLGGPGTPLVSAPFINLSEKKRLDISVFHYDQFKAFLSQLNLIERPVFSEDKPGFFDTCVKLCKMLIYKLNTFEREENKKLGPGQKPKDPGAVLVFLPGLAEIQTLRDHLQEKVEWEEAGKLELECIPLHSSLPWEEHQRIFKPVKSGKRKVVLSTNIAESSLTIPDIRYVIDFCLTKNMVAAEETNYPQLRLEWASKHQLIQRAGRAGRVDHNGRVYRLIPDHLFQNLPEEHVPEIQRVPLSKVVLDVKMLDMGSPKELLALAMDPPELRKLQMTVVELKEIGALLTTVDGHHDRDDGDLTVLGEIVACLPLDIKLGKLIVLGHIFNVLEESIIVAAGLNGKSIFTSPFDKRVQAYKNKLYWADRTFSDCFAILLAYTAWDKYKKRGAFNMVDGVTQREEQFCSANFLQKNQLMEMKLLVEDITRSLKMIDIEPLHIQSPSKWNDDEKFMILRLVMFGAFYPNYFTKHSNSELEHLAHKTLVGRDPRNTVYLQGFDHDQSQYGHLYEDQIKKSLEAATVDKEKMNIIFDGRKIFIVFERDLVEDRCSDKERENWRWNMTGDVLHQVYVSVKLRSQGSLSNKRLSVNLYQPEVAEQKHKEWEEAVARMKTKNITSYKLKNDNIKQVEPPGPEVTEIQVVPVHVSSPTRFWIHYKDNWQEEDWEDRLQFSIGELAKSGRLEVVNPAEVRRCCVYLVLWSELDEASIFYRARVDSVNGTKVTVFFIDYGNVDSVDVDKIMVITDDMIRDYRNLVETPGLAVECSLAGIQPSRIRNSKGLWDEEVVCRFNSLVEEAVNVGRLVGKIYSVIKSGTGNSNFLLALDSLEMRITNSPRVQDVKTTLVKERLADVISESYISKQNHQERDQFARYNQAMQEHLRNFAKHKPAGFLPKASVDSTKQRIKLTLQGPFSPLEHKVTCSYRQGMGKLSNITPDSVNGVMLDQSPGDPHEHWMCAAHVGMSPNGDSLLLRSTSWLPSRPGMGALAVMIFSPQVEVRHNKEVTKLTGCIAGLGPKTDWGSSTSEVTKEMKTRAFYTEHDIELKFDVEITNEDLNMINKVRFWMNQMLLRTDSDGIMTLTQPKNLDLAQKSIKKYLQDLFAKERAYQDKQGLPCGHEFRWNLIKSGLRLVSRTQQDGCVYKMIDGVRLGKAGKENLERMIALWQKASKVDNSRMVEMEQCPACPGEMMATYREIFLHLNTASHKTEECKLLSKCGVEQTVV